MESPSWGNSFNVFLRCVPQKGLREYGLKSSLLNHAIDCLKDQFNYSEMSKHWLPPAVAPIFRLIALELEKRESKRDGDSQTEAGDVGDVVGGLNSQ